jgi:hypothetical protein
VFVDKTQSIIFHYEQLLVPFGNGVLGLLKVKFESDLKVMHVSARSDSFRIICIAMCFVVPPRSSLQKNLEASLSIHIEISRG